MSKKARSAADNDEPAANPSPNMPLMQTPRIPANEKERLEALRRSNLLHTPRDAVFDQVCQLAARLLNTLMSTVTLMDESQQWFKSKVGLTGQGGPREISFCG